jgi:hypothetical protein
MPDAKAVNRPPLLYLCLKFRGKMHHTTALDTLATREAE